MDTLPLWTWFLGVFLLGAILVYAMMRNRQRSRTERIITNEATKELYRQENRSR
jgi:cytochrome c-type biogenesis protein CcmH/NrfF